MATIQLKFVLVGPHADKTLDVNGHPFTDGGYEYVGDSKNVDVLKRIFANYGAYAEGEEAEAARERYALAELGRDLGDDTSGAVSTTLGQGGANTQSLESAPKPTLGDAIGALDPENDAHWTSNNLPSLDHLSEQTGAKVSRGEVDAIAEGYTRAKARANKA